MAFGVKFIPLTPADQLPSRRGGSLADITNTSAHFPSEEINKATHSFDVMMNDFFRNYSHWNHSGSDHSKSPGTPTQINIVNDGKMEVDSELEPREDLESTDPQHFDFSFSMEDQSSTPESNEYDIALARMVELRALLLETFPEGMPKEIDYERILADQHVLSDPLDLSFWDHFQCSVQTESTPDGK